VKDAMLVLLPVLLNKNHENYDKIRAILLYIFSINGNGDFIFMHTLKYPALISLCSIYFVVYIKYTKGFHHGLSHNASIEF
jgi:hypothetical protein